MEVKSRDGSLTSPTAVIIGESQSLSLSFLIHEMGMLILTFGAHCKYYI